MSRPTRTRVAKIVLTGESDTGADRIYSLKLPAGGRLTR
jgi:hypothetical protein